MARDPKERFSDRVAAYRLYRPSYPREVVGALGLAPGATVADLGSGTGIFSELLLYAGYRVFAVEPNEAMRHAAEAELARYPCFTSVAGSGERTTLADRSVDCVTAAQAFHWFDREKAREEFARILRPNGRVALIWNERVFKTPFQEAYERLVRKYGTDYCTLVDRGLDDVSLERFFEPGTHGKRVFPNQQVFDWDGLVGRLASASYMPKEGRPEYAAMMRDVEEMFAAGEVGGRVTLDYETLVYMGRVT